MAVQVTSRLSPTTRYTVWARLGHIRGGDCDTSGGGEGSEEVCVTVCVRSEKVSRSPDLILILLRQVTGVEEESGLNFGLFPVYRLPNHDEDCSQSTLSIMFIPTYLI